MRVADIAPKLNGTIVGGIEAADKEVTGGYVSDLLSDVMGNASAGDVWVTIQKHVNTIAVAHLRDIAAIVLANGRQPEEEMVRRAVEEQVSVIVTQLPVFDVAGILYGLGLRGGRKP